MEFKASALLLTMLTLNFTIFPMRYAEGLNKDLVRHSFKHNPKMVRSLLEQKAQVNCLSLNGQTPLTAALGGPYGNIFEGLRDYPMSDEKKTLKIQTIGILASASLAKAGQDTLQVEENTSNKAVWKTLKDLLIASLGCLEEDFMVAACTGNISVLRELISRGAYVNFNSFGKTPLMWAACFGRGDSVRFLLENGANVDAMDDKSATALVYALRFYDTEKNAKKELLSDEPNLDNDTRAERRRIAIDIEGCYSSIISDLLKWGAKTNLMFIDGSLPEFFWENIKRENAITQHLLLNQAKANLKRSPILHEAIDKADVEILRKLLLAGADPNCRNSEGDTALKVAVSIGETEKVDALLNAGASPDVLDNYGMTLLAEAALKGKVEVIRFILDRGAEVNAKNTLSSTPIMHAAISGSGETVSALLEAGANVDAVNDNGDTALIFAVRYGFTGIVSALLEAGANVNVVNKSGYTALMIASSTGREEYWRYRRHLLDQNLEQRKKTIFDIVSLLLSAGAKISKDAIKLLECIQFDDGPRIKTTGNPIVLPENEPAMCPTEFSIPQVQDLIRQVLYERRLHVELSNCIQLGDFTTFKQLLKENPGCHHNTSMLILASGLGQTLMVEMLLKNDTDVNFVAEGTALMAAASRGHIEIVKLLLSQGDININAKSISEQSTALMYATQNGYAEVTKMLLDSGANPDEAFVLACLNDHTEIMKTLLDAGANPDTTFNEKNDPILLYAAVNGRAEAVNVLLGMDADVNKVNTEGKTPLMGAAHEGHIEILDHLIKAGANLEAKTKRGYTALEWAGILGVAKSVKILLSANADIPKDMSKFSDDIKAIVQNENRRRIKKIAAASKNIKKAK